MSSVITCCDIDLGSRLYRLHPLDGPPQAMSHVSKLLAHGGRTGGLPMGTSEQRLMSKVMSQPGYLFVELVQLRQQHLIAGPRQHECVGGIVDILRRTGKTDELCCRGHIRLLLYMFLAPVLHRLDIMVRHAYDFLDAHGILL